MQPSYSRGQASGVPTLPWCEWRRKEANVTVILVLVVQLREAMEEAKLIRRM